MSSIFISYSRKDIEFAKRLTEAFKSQDLDFWIDWEGIPPTVDWWREIEKGIEESDIFLFLISPDSAASKVCKKEIVHAVKNGKRLIPVVIRDVTGSHTPDELGVLNWIFLRSTDDFDSGFSKLIVSINTDYAWVQVHRQLQVKSLEWERGDRDRSFLLRGKELTDAELQLAKNTSRDPYPTDLQREYIFASRKMTDRQRQTFAITIVIVAIALLGLGIFSVFKAVEATNQAATAQAASTQASSSAATSQANEILAKERARISRSAELAAYAMSQKEEDFPKSLLLGIEAFKTADTPRTYTTLFDLAHSNPQISEYISLAEGERVGALAFSPNGNAMAVGVSDRIILLDRATRETLGQFVDNDGGGVNQVTFSPNGDRLISRFCEFLLLPYQCQSDIILWDMDSRQIIGEPYHGLAYAVSFTANLLAVANNDGGISLWDPSTHHVIDQLSPEQSGLVLTLTFSPDGKTLASGSDDGKVLLWDVPTWQLKSQLSNYSKISNIAFGPDGKTLAFSTSSNPNRIALWDVATLQPIQRTPPSHVEVVDNIVFSPDGETLASVSSYDKIMLWSLSSQAVLSMETGLVYGRVSLAFSPDGKRLALGGANNNSFSVWNLKTQLPVSYTLPVKGGAITAYSPNGNIVASVGESGLFLWNVDKAQSKIIKPGIGVSSLLFSPDNKLLAIGSCRTWKEQYSCKESEILLWDVTTNQQVGILFPGTGGSITHLAFSPDVKHLATSDEERNIFLWDVARKQLLRQQPLTVGSEISGLEFSPNGQILAVASRQGGQVILFDTNIYEPMETTLSNGYEAYSIAFSPDSTTLVSGLGVFLTWWDVKKLSLTYSSALVFESSQIAFSPNRNILAVTYGNAFEIWDVGARQQIGQTLNASDSGNITELAFSNDGMTMLTASTDGMIILWNMNPQSWIQASCQRAGRNLTQAEWTQYFPDEEYRPTCSQWPTGH